MVNYIVKLGVSCTCDMSLADECYCGRSRSWGDFYRVTKILKEFETEKEANYYVNMYINERDHSGGYKRVENGINGFITVSCNDVKLFEKEINTYPLPEDYDSLKIVEDEDDEEIYD